MNSSKYSGRRHARARFARLSLCTLSIAMLIGIRVWLAFSVAEDSDESQHLHVAWSVAQGLVPYRDVFDNHAPMFQLAFAPIVAAIGERADIVPLMRLTMIPFYLVALWLTWYIGRALWSSQVGTIAAAITAAAPIFFRTSVEFRPDVPWMVGWLGVVAVVVSPLRGTAKSAVAASLLGATFAISLKTTLLAATAIVAALTIFHAAPGARVAMKHALTGVVAVLVVPVIFLAYLAHAGAWDAMVYCLVDHNVVAGLGSWNNVGILEISLVATGAAGVFALHYLAKRNAREQCALWRLWMLFSAALYVFALYGFWPLVTHQDLLPVLPLVAVSTAAIFEPSASRFASGVFRPALAAAVTTVCFVNIAAVLLDDQGGLSYAEGRRQRVLDLAGSRDPVMDAKGFSIFRDRPTYWVLESITEKRIRDGTLRDPIAAALSDTSTPIVLADNLPAADRTFVESNYLCADHAIFLAGQWLRPGADPLVRVFNIAIPLSYKVIDEQGAVPVRIDGRSVAGPINLDAGAHTLETDRDGAVAIIWAGHADVGRAPTALSIRQPDSC